MKTHTVVVTTFARCLDHCAKADGDWFAVHGAWAAWLQGLGALALILFSLVQLRREIVRSRLEARDWVGLCDDTLADILIALLPAMKEAERGGSISEVASRVSQPAPHLQIEAAEKLRSIPFQDWPTYSLFKGFDPLPRALHSFLVVVRQCNTIRDLDMVGEVAVASLELLADYDKRAQAACGYDILDVKRRVPLLERSNLSVS